VIASFIVEQVVLGLAADWAGHRLANVPTR
jgi:hypothetical protein